MIEPTELTENTEPTELTEQTGRAGRSRYDSRNEILDPEKFPNFLVRDTRSIAQFINALAEKHCLLSVFLPCGSSFMSAILSVADDQSWLILDRSPDETLNDRAEQSELLTCVTRLDGIRIQFALNGVDRFPYDGFEALQAYMPSALLRLQRRECFRQPVPMSHPAICRITLTQPDGSLKTTALRVVDISAGGLALAVEPGSFELSAGTVFENCQLVLPDVEPAAIQLKLRNQFRMELRNDHTIIRAGCDFIDLPAKVATHVQRYIFKIERDRRALQTSG